MDGRLAAQLVQAAVPVITLLALVLAFRPRTGLPLSESTRARAQWLTVAAGVVAAYLLAVTVLRALEQNPLGIIVFLTFCGSTAVSALIVGWAWRRHYAAVRDEEPRFSHADDEASGPHRGLSGEDVPPSRW